MTKVLLVKFHGRSVTTRTSNSSYGDGFHTNQTVSRGSDARAVNWGSRSNRVFKTLSRGAATGLIASGSCGRVGDRRWVLKCGTVSNNRGH